MRSVGCRGVCLDALRVRPGVFGNMVLEFWVTSAMQVSNSFSWFSITKGQTLSARMQSSMM